jgi:hypothetical protein
MWCKWTSNYQHDKKSFWRWNNVKILCYRISALRYQLRPIPGLDWRGPNSKLIWMLVEFSFLPALRLRVSGSCWLEAALSSLSCEPYCSTAPNTACFMKANKRKSSGKIDITILCNIVTEVTSHHLWYILLARDKSLVLSPQEVGINEGHDKRRWE